MNTSRWMVPMVINYNIYWGKMLLELALGIIKIKMHTRIK